MKVSGPSFAPKRHKGKNLHMNNPHYLMTGFFTLRLFIRAIA
jgi:hypothetical protein